MAQKGASALGLSTRSKSPRPKSASTPATLRARRSPLDMTRTTLEGLSESPRTRETCARGNAPVGVQSAISRARVRREARMPTRSISRSRRVAQVAKGTDHALERLGVLLFEQGAFVHADDLLRVAPVHAQRELSVLVDGGELDLVAVTPLVLGKADGFDQIIDFFRREAADPAQRRSAGSLL